MKKFALAAVAGLMLSSGSAQAMNCGAVFDELSKAVSGHVTMSAAQRVALMRMATESYDQCMAGDSKHAGATRTMIMDQIKKSLGGN